MGQGTEELTRDIQDTRDELAHDLDALQDKVSPSAIVERRKAAARDRLHGVRSRVMGTATSVGSAGGNVGGQASNAASNVADAAEQRFEGSPLAAGLTLSCSASTFCVIDARVSAISLLSSSVLWPMPRPP